MGFFAAQLRPSRFCRLVRFCNRLGFGRLFAKIKLLISIRLGLICAERAVVRRFLVALLVVRDIVEAELLASFFVVVLLAVFLRVCCFVVL